MSILKNPNEIHEALTLAGIIYGQPGVGKSTLALSAPNPVMIDADKGMKRVEKRFQVPSLPLNNYKDLLELMQSKEIDPFDTIVFDTLGKLVDRMSDYLGEENPKNKKGDGSLSMQGWGALKVEFQKLLKLAQSKNKHLIFVAHEKEEKDGDTRIVRPDVSGSSGKDLVKDLDFMGYMEMKGTKKTISFNPSEKFYAKNSLKLPNVIDVPDTNIVGENTFIQKFIIEKTVERLQEDNEQNAKYDELLEELTAAINKVKDAKTANEALKAVNESAVIWDSQRVAKKALNEKVKALGLAYDKEKSEFKKAPKSDDKKEEAKEAVAA
jgi:hypothetical protein